MGQNFGPNPGNGAYYPVAIAGNLFRGGNQAAAAAAMAAGLPTTYTGGLILANPAASSNNLIIQRVTAAFVAVQTNASAISLGVGVSATAITSPGTAIPSQNGQPSNATAAQGILYSPTSATLPVAPYLSALVGVVDSGATTVETQAAGITLDLQGSIILPPGSFACFLSSAAGTVSSFLGSFTWVELPYSATAG